MSIDGAPVFARLGPGFADPVRGSQSCFRAILDAMAHPGRIVELPAMLASAPPAPIGAAAAAIALTLCDADTPVWLDNGTAAVAGYIAFHCGSPLVERAAKARFAFISHPTALPALDTFELGSDEFPEQSATLVIEVRALAESAGITLSGPGIRDAVLLLAAGLPTRFWAERTRFSEIFPRGLDVLFVSGNRLAALPRSTHISGVGAA